MHSKIVFLAGAVPEGRVFGLDSKTFIDAGIQLLNGIILAIALGFILYKPVKEFMQKRTESIKSKIDDADATMAKANELISEYNAKIKEIDKERIGILEATRLKASEESKIIIEAANQEAIKIKKRSLESVAADKKRLHEESRLYIIELASIMAEKYIAQNIGSEAHDRIFEETLTQMEGAQWQI